MTLYALRLGWLLAVILAVTASSPALAHPAIIGIASVIDGDTIEIHGERIRLEGIDAPEGRQRCLRAGVEWRCGQAAALALDEWIASRTVQCRATGKDRYGRLLARCSVSGEDMQAWLVRNGFALAYRRYSLDYVAIEDQARAARSGVWSSEFMLPWEWRKLH